MYAYIILWEEISLQENSSYNRYVPITGVLITDFYCIYMVIIHSGDDTRIVYEL